MKTISQLTEGLLSGIAASPAEQPPSTTDGTTATPPREPTTPEKTSSPADEPNENWQDLPLRDSPEGQDELTRLLTQTYASQKAYGDKGQMMEFRDGMFQLVLADFPYRRIREAFVEHVRRKPDLPTPSDIVNLLDPPKLPLSAAAYSALRRKIEQEGYYPLSDERTFMRAFEAQEMAKARA